MNSLMMPNILTLFSIFVSIYGNSVTDDSDCPLHPGITSTCSETNVFYESECDESICGIDPMCIEYQRIANKLNCRSNNDLQYELRNVTHLSNNRSERTISYIETTRYSDYIYNDTCKHNLAFLEEVGNPNEFSANTTSFSPWEYIINIDENRIPREILETKCRCQFCLNSDRNGTTERYLTHPMMVTRYFLMKGNGSTIFNAEFSYGCACQYNNAA